MGTAWHFVPDRVWITDGERRVIDQRKRPSCLVRRPYPRDPWDQLHRLYFTSYAVWNYLNTPFLFTLPGFEVREIEPHQENGEKLAMSVGQIPRQTFLLTTGSKPAANKHSSLMKRGSAAARLRGRRSSRHCCFDHATFEGVVFPHFAGSSAGRAARKCPDVCATSDHRCRGKRLIKPGSGRRDQRSPPTQFVQAGGFVFAYRGSDKTLRTPWSSCSIFAAESSLFKMENHRRRRDHNKRGLSTMTTSREIRLKSRIVGAPVADNFELATVSVPAPALGEVQVKISGCRSTLICAVAWSTARVYDPHPPLGGATPAAKSERLPRPILLCTAGARRSSRASVAGRRGR